MAATTSAMIPVEVAARRSDMVGSPRRVGTSLSHPSEPVTKKPGAPSVSTGAELLPMGPKNCTPPTRFARPNSGNTRLRGCARDNARWHASGSNRNGGAPMPAEQQAHDAVMSIFVDSK